MICNKHTPIVLAVGFTALSVAVSIIGVLFLTSFFKYDRYDKKDFIDQTAYQAVFLTNDQIYFGHLKNINSDYLLLSDVHYIKINEDGAGQIVKLGVIEPHGPQDKMIINQDQVLYWENLKPSSQVVETIRSLQLQKR